MRDEEIEMLDYIMGSRQRTRELESNRSLLTSIRSAFPLWCFIKYTIKSVYIGGQCSQLRRETKKKQEADIIQSKFYLTELMTSLEEGKKD